jgi:MOSC domain-containing protein
MVEKGVVKSLYRYPVKGLSPQALTRIQLAPGETVPADRLYAIENGPCGFDPAAPAYFPKIRFLMLMRNERLAALRTDYDDASHTLVI